MYEAVEFIEIRGRIDPVERYLGDFDSETDAAAVARTARAEFLEGGRDEYAWWVVRRKGERLAHFIADSKSPKEFVLDLTSGELVEL